MDSFGVGIFVVGLVLSCLCMFGSVWLKKIADRKQEEGKDNGAFSASWVILATLAAVCIVGCAYQGFRLSQAPSAAPGQVVQKSVHFDPQVREIPPAVADSTPEQRQADLDYMNNLRLPDAPVAPQAPLPRKAKR